MTDPKSEAPELLHASPKLPTYSAHLIPCKVRYTGPTDEFKSNFELDASNDEVSGQSEKESNQDVSHVTYLRGRKIIGQELLPTKDYAAFLMSTPSESPEAPGTAMKPVARLSSVTNYEREGNEERLQEEMGKFNDFIELNDIVHS